MKWRLTRFASSSCENSRAILFLKGFFRFFKVLPVTFYFTFISFFSEGRDNLFNIVESRFDKSSYFNYNFLLRFNLFFLTIFLFLFCLNSAFAGVVIYPIDQNLAVVADTNDWECKWQKNSSGPCRWPCRGIGVADYVRGNNNHFPVSFIVFRRDISLPGPQIKDMVTKVTDRARNFLKSYASETSTIIKNFSFRGRVDNGFFFEGEYYNSQDPFSCSGDSGNFFLFIDCTPFSNHSDGHNWDLIMFIKIKNGSDKELIDKDEVLDKCLKLIRPLVGNK